MSDVERLLAEAAPTDGVTEQVVAARLRRAVFGGAPASPSGRYTLLERVGDGGMGSVWAAWDAKLDRKVALKFLRSQRGDDAEHEARLLREAQALARLSDPHVVAVFDVTSWTPPDGDGPTQVVLAMEYLPGTTLEAWLRAAPRTWREVLDVFAQAGRGLAAAHRAGLVHRDVKPHNVIVDPRGRAEVVDFGLALTAGDTTSAAEVAGTPRYMAPEQYRGTEIDARADQFAWCAALWEALAGAPPFRGETAAALLQDKLGGAPRPGPKSIPSWIRRVLERGLAVDPAARWPDMDALLAVLARDPARAWRRRLAVLALAGAAAGVAAAWPRPAQCDDGAERFAALWHERRAEDIGAAFNATGRPYAAVTWATARAELDRYAAAWAAVRDDACRAHRDGAQSDDLFDRRIACLERRRERVRAVLDRFAAPDGAMVDRISAALARLPPPEHCSDATALRREVAEPEDAEAAALVRTIDRQLADGRAAIDAGHAEDGLAAAVRAQQAYAAGGLDHAPTAAAAALVEGEALGWLGRSDEARASLTRAAAAALRAADDEGFAHAAAQLVWELGDVARDFEAAASWAALGEAALARAGSPPAITYLLGNAVATADLDADRSAAAIGRLERELATIEAAFGARDYRIFVLRTNLANAHYREQRWDQAGMQYEQALALGGELLGATHPRVLLARMNFAALLHATGREAEARAELDVLLEGQRQTIGAQHPDYAAALVLRAMVRHALGDPLAALDDADAALVALGGGAAKGHVAARAHFMRARVLLEQGRLDAAEHAVGSAAAELDALYDAPNSDHLPLAELRGELARARGDVPAARAAYGHMLELAVVTGDAEQQAAARGHLAALEKDASAGGEHARDGAR